jgi:hypothetical protein
MIHAGEQKPTKYWGKRTAVKVAQLKQPVECHNITQGTVFFKPTIVKIEWEIPPSSDKNEFWFPYWMIVNGKEKYGQFAPMIGEKALLELLQDAINQDFFSDNFLQTLGQTISMKFNNDLTI